MPKASPSRALRHKPPADNLHRRNRYHHAPPDFDQLGRQYPEFAQCLTKVPSRRPTLDFRDPTKVRMLARALLKADFDLDVQIPAQSLCPMIPGRLDYIHCIEDLMGLCDPLQQGQVPVRGLDIGTGASCIYPLLACRLHSSWHFLATDTHLPSVDVARVNVARNGLSDRIAVTHSHDPNVKLPLDMTTASANRPRFDFCMCNPPYYRDEIEMADLQNAKPNLPPTTLPGQPHELMTQGGEQQFVTGLIDESWQARGVITWYTSLIGRSTTLAPLTQYLTALGMTNYAIAELCPSRTRRWVLIWTFGLQRIVSKVGEL
ncbi:hypothetical protein H4R34_004796 [Dimargaris verticillata]|uniref:U6 small nuclear RNA (adenine-(43)-N(6))-methyltransferase n=1 Tax=Dimargaris verticillata TaxID=2761393 RepID=A0A9W8EBV1_9FUNG|nr:hypothetical protein H4R34_004796 [Dimargaris verticillata]